MLCELLQGFHLEQTLNVAKANTSQQIIHRIDAALAHRATPIEVATQDLGQSCPLDNSFPSALVAYIQNQTNFKNAIIATIQAGGDQAGRAAMLGAWLGAQLGFQNLPSDWIDSIAAKERIAQALYNLSFS